MEDIRIHNWTLTRSKTYGFSLQDYIRKYLCECGVTMDCPCGKACSSCSKPVAVPVIQQSLSTAPQVGMLIDVMEHMDKSFKEQIKLLKAEIEELKK